MYNICIYIYFVLCYIKYVFLVFMKLGYISSYEQMKKNMYYLFQFVYCELYVFFFSLGRVFFDNLEKLFGRIDEK